MNEENLHKKIEESLALAEQILPQKAPEGFSEKVMLRLKQEPKVVQLSVRWFQAAVAATILFAFLNIQNLALNNNSSNDDTELLMQSFSMDEQAFYEDEVDSSWFY